MKTALCILAMTPALIGIAWLIVDLCRVFGIKDVLIDLGEAILIAAVVIGFFAGLSCLMRS